MNIAVFGLGYVGLIAAGCLTSQGHKVFGVDISEKKVDAVNAGRSPIVEPGLEELLSEAVRKGLLSCSTNVADKLDDCDVAIVCVGTPSGLDGSHNMSFIAEVSRQIASAIRSGRSRPLTIVYRSTLRPGTIEELVWPIIRTYVGADAKGLEIAYNPEFLREAHGVKDYFAPPKIVIGTADGQPNKALAELNKGIDAPTFVTHYREAEFTKFVDNTFHALKVSFGNEIGRVCLKLGISASKIHEIFIADTKLNISSAYFRPGGAFGGSCLPKDVRALQHISMDVGASTHLIDSLLRSNDAHKHFLFERVVHGLEPGASVLMLGLAFKAGSDDLRESPKIDMARKLLQAGFALSIHDPSLEPSQLIGQNLGYAFSHLPSLPQLLIGPEEIKDRRFDLVIDTLGLASDLALRSERIVNLEALD
ncbi:MAG TPA: nucleotide sugar dehydrogenase [Caulobacteraceae bacterium]|jgi:GDP-mannose 6-dehydrogenase|nr:nucleotide sugar dehydrogenase [Caulobacteraceae bacterium]